MSSCRTQIRCCEWLDRWHCWVVATVLATDGATQRSHGEKEKGGQASNSGSEKENGVASSSKRARLAYYDEVLSHASYGAGALNGSTIGTAGQVNADFGERNGFSGTSKGSTPT
jgi:hypothetical protein